MATSVRPRRRRWRCRTGDRCRWQNATEIGAACNTLTGAVLQPAHRTVVRIKRAKSGRAALLDNGNRYLDSSPAPTLCALPTPT
ncbi:MAG: hypothetical protein R2911_30545 [Caldilineaceae bacterium]